VKVGFSLATAHVLLLCPSLSDPRSESPTPKPWPLAPPYPHTLAPADQGPLQHVLLNHIEREATVTDHAGVDPKAPAVFHAFETLDCGKTLVMLRWDVRR
jgi:hypothetical protein